MKRVPDRKKQRREYLRKKGEAYTDLSFKGLLFVPFFLYTLICFGSAFYILVVMRLPGDGIIALVSALLSGAGARWCVQDVKKARQAAKLPYVPPVTPSTLPAEEVLVRGAEEPSTPKETLLRATVKGEETKAEELLRSHLP